MKNWQCRWAECGGGGALSYAALSRMSQKREHHFRDTLFCVVPPGIVIYFQVVEYHSFIKATQP